MACFDNYILVRGHCGTATPSTSLYINDLPGITLSAAANTAQELQTGVTLLNRCIEQGITNTREQLVGEILGTYQFNKAVSTGSYGMFTEDIDLTANYLSTSVSERGLKFELRNDCRLTQFHVKRVRVLTNTSGEQTLTIIDGVTENNYVFTSVAKVPQWVETNYFANSEQIKIVMDDVSVNNSTLNYTGDCGFCSNDCASCGSCGCTSGLSVWGWDGTNENGNTYGLSAIVHVVCSEEKFFCEISQLSSVAQMVWKNAGVVFLDNLLHTNRINVYTIYGKEDAANLKAQWQEEVIELKEKLAKQLPKYLSQIDSCCIECNSSRWEFSTP